MKRSRRFFLKRTGLAIGGTLILPACYHEPAPYRFFSQAEANCLIALCECIIPADDAPGATDAGVIYYIDKQIMGPFKKHQSDYREGLKEWQYNCRSIMGSDFEALKMTEQIRFLEMVEENNEQLQNISNNSTTRFFKLVIAHTMQGFYGAPRHGGNKNYLSYQMLGIGFPQIIGQNRYGKGDSNG